MSTRLAIASDLGNFSRLWRAMSLEVEEQFPRGELTYTEHNHSKHLEIFKNYTTGFIDGVVVFWEIPNETRPVGVAMGGLYQEDNFKSKWEKPAFVHGIYVDPRYRKQGGMQEVYLAAKQALKELSFTTVLGSVTVGNKNSYKFNSLMGASAYAVLMESEI